MSRGSGAEEYKWGQNIIDNVGDTASCSQHDFQLAGRITYSLRSLPWDFFG